MRRRVANHTRARPRRRSPCYGPLRGRPRLHGLQRPREPDIRGLGTFDLVLAADVLYERKNAAGLADLVPKLLAPGAEAIFADPRRDEAPVFLEAMEGLGFENTIEETVVEQASKKVRVFFHRMKQ